MTGRRTGAGGSGRIRMVLALALVAVGAMVGAAGADQRPTTAASVAAFNGDGGSCAVPAIVVRRLVVARLVSLPAAPVRVDVHRATVAPGGLLAPVAAGGAIAIFVDSGAVRAEVAGEAVLTRAAVPGATTWPDPVPVGGTVALRYSDHLLVAAEAAVHVVNDGTVPAVLVVVRALPQEAPVVPFAVAGGDAAVEWATLAEGVFADVPPPPVYLLMTRVVYAAGASDPVPTENGGPMALAIEAGTVGYLLTAGNGAVVGVGSDTGRPVEPEEEVILPAGAYAVEAWGAVSRLRNPSTDERAWVLVTTLVPASPPDTSAAAPPEESCESEARIVQTRRLLTLAPPASPG